jgi:RimJ/RimL family protein N-acetyltransferase
MTPLRTQRLILRQWREDDRELFHLINSDPEVMAFFPRRRDRAQSDALMDLLNREIGSDGFGLAAVEIAETGETAGFCGLSPVDLEPVFTPETIEIAWRLARPFWGKGIASEAAREWLRYGFEDLGLDQVIAIAVQANRRSIAVMERIGMRRDDAGDFDHPRIGDDMPHLKRHSLHVIDAAQWAAGRRK